MEGKQTLPLGKNNFSDGQIPAYQQVEKQNEVAFYRAGYDGEIQLMDEAIGQLLHSLRNDGAFDNAIIVLQQTMVKAWVKKIIGLAMESACIFHWFEFR